MSDSNESAKTETKSKGVFKMPKGDENIKVGQFEDCGCCGNGESCKAYY